ncbi:hypothetical protein [Phormidesmis priestleyi]|uniref:hypothetical protein n=1 Tax=Phormidesmis priestleyi TaxID=268141 RepID=UPI00083A6B3B|nr:hypothetical protein [Phormidesmis priestleyi]
MCKLASHLQKEFIRRTLPGWTCRSESRLLPLELEKYLGYKPRADVLLERDDGSKRLWIEFEISRADPVANHAKFATAHLFHPQSANDIFVSMVSSHVDLGRRNLAANTVLLMRCVGMNAFQTVLLPQFSPEQIRQLNQLPREALEQETLCVEREIQRATSISEAVTTTPDKRIYFASDIPDVVLNLQRWNREVVTTRGRELWGKRTVTYFVFDPKTKLFAPSKFCAYIPVESANLILQIKSNGLMRPEMNLDLYMTLDQTDKRFDGQRARLHLTQSLAMIAEKKSENSVLANLFDEWLEQRSESISIHPNGAVFLSPPEWFGKPTRAKKMFTN